MVKAAQEARWRFSLIALLLGVSYTCVAPPLMAPDEALHLMRAYELSQGRLITRRDERGTYYEAPAALAQLSEDDAALRSELTRRLDVATLFEAIFVRVAPLASRRVDALSDTRSPLAYAPFLPGIWMARVLGSSPLLLLYLARLSGLAVFVGLTGLAIVWAERLAWLWLAIALSPALLIQAASCSPDSCAIALALAFFALGARALTAREEGLAAADRGLLLVLFVGLSQFGVQYLAFVLALFVCKWPRIKVASASLAAPIIALVAATVSTSIVIILRYPSWSSLVQELLPLGAWMLDHPFLTLKTWVRTVFKCVNDYAIEAVVGPAPFPLDLRFVAGLVTALQVELMAMLAWGALALKVGDHDRARRGRRYLAACGVLYMTLSFALHHAAVTDHRPTWPVYSLSGAAFIPLMPALLGIFATFGKPVATRWWSKRHGYRVLVLATSLNLLCLLVLVGRYYAAVDPEWPY